MNQEKTDRRVPASPVGGRELLTVVVPVFNEGETIDVFYTRMKKVVDSLSPMSYELIFVDDGSRDDSFAKLTSLADHDDTRQGRQAFKELRTPERGNCRGRYGPGGRRRDHRRRSPGSPGGHSKHDPQVEGRVRCRVWSPGKQGRGKVDETVSRQPFSTGS